MSDEKKVDEKKVGAVLEAFKLIREDNARIEEKLDRLLRHLGADKPASNGNGGNGSGGGAVATVAEIQGDHGDFEVKFEPRSWKGPSFKGSYISQCPPEFLDMLADMLDNFADNPLPGKEKSSKFKRLDAARCRRWAIEIREGRVKPKVQREMAPPPGDNGASWSSGGGNPPPMDDDGLGPPPGSDDSDVPF